MYNVTCMSPLPYISEITEAFRQSTLPFVWDDPISIADLKQVSVDLANGAARGKSGGHQFPKTACLVTANFDIHKLKSKRPHPETVIKILRIKSSEG